MTLFSRCLRLALQAKLAIIVLVLSGVLIIIWFIRGLLPLSPERIASKVSEAVVVVQASGRSGDIFGTGFAVSDSVIATSFHVVRGSTQITIQLQGGQTLGSAKVLTYDARRDLALVAVPRLKLTPLSIAVDNSVSQGSRVFAFGHPEGLEFSLSEGLVSAVRDLGDVRVLQMTAPISQGSSGGPVVDSHARVVGVSTAYLGEGQNLNFAVVAGYLRGLLSSTNSAESAIAARGSQVRTVGPFGASELEPGVYDVGYSVAGQGQDAAFYIEKVGDSISGRFGLATAFTLPTSSFTAPIGTTLPVRITLRDAGSRLEIQQVRSPELFVGDIVVESHGSADTIPFTAVRKRPNLEADTSYVLIDEQTTYSQPTGVSKYGFRGLYLAGTITWRDAGTTAVVGAYVPFTSSYWAPTQTVYGTFVFPDSVQFELHHLTCHLATRNWPNVEGACWTSQQWYGITQAAPRSGETRRYLWQVLPPTIERLIGAKIATDGGIDVTYVTDSAVPGKVRRDVYRAWQASATSTWTEPTSISWPPSLPPDVESVGSLLSGGLIVLDSVHFVRWRSPHWDTSAVPLAALQESHHDSLVVATARLGGQRDLVVWSRGACDLFAGSDTSHGPGCRTEVVLHDQRSDRWTRLPVPPMLDSLPRGYGHYLLGDTALLLEFDRTWSKPEYVIATANGIRTVSSPLPDTGVQRPELAFGSVADSGVVYGIVQYCPRGEERCGPRHDVVAWTPGRGVRTLASDSSDVLSGASLFVTNLGRVVVQSRGMLRFIDRWDAPIATAAAGSVFGATLAVLEDTLARRVYIVTQLGEVVSLQMPVARSRDGNATALTRLWRWLRALRLN